MSINAMHAKSGLRVHLEWIDYRPDSVIIAVIRLVVRRKLALPEFTHFSILLLPKLKVNYGPRFFNCAHPLHIQWLRGFAGSRRR